MARSVFATATESGIVGSSVAGSVTGNVRGGVVASLGGSGAMVTVAFRPRSVLGTPDTEDVAPGTAAARNVRSGRPGITAGTVKTRSAFVGGATPVA